jgi:hypothetical protein
MLLNAGKVADGCQRDQLLERWLPKRFAGWKKQWGDRCARVRMEDKRGMLSGEERHGHALAPGDPDSQKGSAPMSQRHGTHENLDR